jgi:hypothetical protein
MINSTLERQAKSTDEQLCRLIEERDGKKLTLLASILLLLLVLLVLLKVIHHFYSPTTIEGLIPTFEVLQQTTASMFWQGYMQTAPIFSMPNITSAPNTPVSNV